MHLIIIFKNEFMPIQKERTLTSPFTNLLKIENEFTSFDRFSIKFKLT